MDAKNSLVPVDKERKYIEAEALQLVERSLTSVRDDIQDSPYIQEALRVLPAGGYRSAIGSFWNAVVDDLRNKVMARSLSLFNKTVTQKREIRTYEDFQNWVNDDDLIEGAYKIGVIGWEASKILKHAKETRHIFDGHPRSSEPSILKVLAMMDDCIKYVLNVPYPATIIDIDEYMSILGDSNFDRSPVAVENAISELPEIYKEELVNRLFTAYVHVNAPSTLRSNIEFVVPILWKVLPKNVKVQLVRRVDQEIPKGNVQSTAQAFALVRLVAGSSYLSAVARKYIIQPLVEQLKNSLDKWKLEDEAAAALAPYATVIPDDLLDDYVTGLVLTYVGTMGQSAYYARKDFYADGAANLIPSMFESFDDRAAEAFIRCVKTSHTLHARIVHAPKLRRLRALANIVSERASKSVSGRDLLELLVDEEHEDRFTRFIAQSKPRKG